jgi:hypothetical protein
MPVLVLGSTGEPGKQDRVDTMLKMILVDGFFQADPHPGNVM